MKKSITTFGVSALAAITAHSATIVSEDFEDSIVTYTTNVPDDIGGIGSLDYYGRLASDTSLPPASVSYSGLATNGFYGAQDSDGSNVSLAADNIEIRWTNINTSSFTNLMLSFDLAEDDSSDGDEDWDTSSSFRVEVDDGNGFAQIFRVESEIGTDGNQTNEKPRVDTDNDGVGDGIEITATYQPFTFALNDAASYDITVFIDFMDAGDEDIAFDNLLLQGDAIPEPSSLGLLAFAGFFALRRRR